MIGEKDRRILNELMADARKSVVDISNDLAIPRATVQERIQRMRQSGVIKKFVAIPDYSLLGRPVTAFILVSFMPGAISQRELGEQISQLPRVDEVHLITGEWDIMLKVRVGSMDELGKLILDKLRAMKGVMRTVTCVCFNTLKEQS
jgi:Lrp/AsnC family leucine-responsive transcriptional regulator